MNRIYSLVWNRSRHTLQVASELARGAGKGKSKTVQRSRAQTKTLGAAFALTLVGTLGIAQAADVVINADDETKTLNSSDTYTKIEATNGGTVDAEGNQVTISAAEAGEGIVKIKDGSSLILDGGGRLENTANDKNSHGLFVWGSEAELTDVDISTYSNSEAVFAIYDANVNMTGGSIRTDHSNGVGVYTWQDSSVTFANVDITTKKSSSDAVSVSNTGTFQMIGGNIVTEGAYSEGVSVAGVDNAEISLTDVVITTSGQRASGIETYYAGAKTNMTGGSITTEGHEAHAVDAWGGGLVMLEDVSVETSGADAYGINAVDTDTRVIMTGGRIDTTGKGAAGVKSGDGAKTVLDGDVKIGTQGVGADGIRASGDAQVEMSGGEITTTGAGSTGVNAYEAKGVTLTDVAIDTAGDNSGGISADNVQVDMAGGSIKTHGESTAEPIAAIHAANGAHVTLTDDVEISTEGDFSIGLDAFNQGTKFEMTGGSITTEGAWAMGVYAAKDVTVDMENVDIETFGNDAMGLTAGDSAQVTLSGGSVAVHGERIDNAVVGVLAEGGAQITLKDDVTISTEGDYSYGLVAADPDTNISMTGGSITTEGFGSYGAVADGAKLTLDGVTIDIRDVGVGVMAADDSTISLLGTSVETQGDDSAGVIIFDSQLTMEGSAVKTTGDSDLVNGPGSVGMNVSGGTSATIADSEITTTGQDSAGLIVGEGGSLVADNMEITTTGDNSGARPMTTGPRMGAAGAVIGEGSTVTFTGGSITTEGADASGMVLVDAADVTLTDTRIDASGATLHWWLDETGPTPQPLSTDPGGIGATDTGGAGATGPSNTVTLDPGNVGVADQVLTAYNTDLTQNDGHLLKVTGGNTATHITLSLNDNTQAAGDITDVASSNRTTLDLHSGSQWTGHTRLDGNLLLSDAGTASHGGTITDPIAISGDVTVNDGAALGGNLAVAGALSLSGGQLRPGNSIGHQTFGSVAGSGAGDYHAEINAAGDSDLITVTDSDFDISGVNLYVDSEDSKKDNYKLDYDYTIIKTENGHEVQGEFANGGELEGELAKSLVKLEPVEYHDDDVQIRLSLDEDKVEDLPDNEKDIIDAEKPPKDDDDPTGEDPTPPEDNEKPDGNQPGEDVTPPPESGDGGESNPDVDDSIQSPDYAERLKRLTGEIHAGTQTALLDSGNLMQRTLSTRMRSNLGVGLCPDIVDSDTDHIDNPHTNCGLDYPFWGRVVGSWNKHDGNSNTASTSYDLGGFYLGSDVDVGDGWRVGGAFGFTDGRVRISELDSKASVTSYTFALYGGNSWALGSGQINWLAGAGYTYHDVDTQRQVDEQSLSASYHGSSQKLFTELSYTLPVAETTAIEPYAGLAWHDLHMHSFNEEGGTAALHGERDRNNITTSTLGMRSKTRFSVGNTDASVLVGLGWRHAWGDRDAKRHMRFRKGTGNTFEIAGAPIAKDMAVVDVGTEAKISSHTAVGLDYSGAFGSGNYSHSGSLYLRVNF